MQGSKRDTDIKNRLLNSVSGVCNWGKRWNSTLNTTKNRGIYSQGAGWEGWSVDGKLLRGDFSSVQLLSHVQLFVTPWTTTLQASLSITSSQSPPKPMSIVSVMPSNHLILYRALLLTPSIFPSIKIFSNELGLRIRWPKCWHFSFNIKEQVGEVGQ